MGQEQEAGRAAERALLESADLTGRMAQTHADEIGALAVAVLDTLRAGGKLLFCGNGGSAADAQHLAAEYVIRFKENRRALAALALTTDSSVLTAGGNDLGYDQVFARQVAALGRPGDLLFLHSTSGNSTNLIEAARTAREMGIGTVGILARDGGALRAEVDRALVVPTDVTARAQEVHLAIGHIICDWVDGQVLAGALEDGPGGGGHG